MRLVVGHVFGLEMNVVALEFGVLTFAVPVRRRNRFEPPTQRLTLPQIIFEHILGWVGLKGGERFITIRAVRLNRRIFLREQSVETVAEHLFHTSEMTDQLLQ